MRCRARELQGVIILHCYHPNTSVSMAQRVPLDSPEKVIRTIETDGAVILTGFSDVSDVERVSADAAPYIRAILAEV